MQNIQPMKLQENVLIDERFRIIRLLGTGGMGSVYLAEQADLNRTVALKVMAAEQFSSEDKDRFIREGQILSELNCPGIVRFYHFGADDNLVYFAMEHVKGQSLRRLITEQTRIPWRRALRIVRNMCLAMHSAHSAGILHRDLKPENILLVEDNDDSIKIIDFGLGRFSEQGKTLTATGLIIGSPEYMSPEQCQGLKATMSSDIYATGIILYELITGQPPFQADTAFGVMHKHSKEKWNSLKQSLPAEKLPLGLNHILEKSLAKSAEQRYASLAEMADDITTLLQDEEDFAEIPLPKHNASKKMPILIVGIVLLAAIPFLAQPLFNKNNSDSSKPIQKQKTKRAIQKSKHSYDHCGWDEILSVARLKTDQGNFNEAQEITKSWLASNSNQDASISEQITKYWFHVELMMIDDPAGTFEVIDKLFKTVAQKANDADKCKLLAARISVNLSPTNEALLKSDTENLERIIRTSTKLTNEQKWMAYRALINATERLGNHEKAIGLVSQASQLDHSPDLTLLKIKILFALKRDDEAKKQAQEFILHESNETEILRAVVVGRAAANASRCDYAASLLRGYLGKLDTQTKESITENQQDSSPALDSYQDSIMKAKQLDSVLSEYAEWSFDEAEFTYHRTKQREPWLRAVKECLRYFNKAKYLMKRKNDLRGLYKNTAYEYCCLRILGQKNDAERVLQEALNAANEEETAASMAARFWDIGQNWCSLEWTPEHIIPLEKSAELYSKSAIPNCATARRVQESLAKELSIYGAEARKIWR